MNLWADKLVEGRRTSAHEMVESLLEIDPVAHGKYWSQRFDLVGQILMLSPFRVIDTLIDSFAGMSAPYVFGKIMELGEDLNKLKRNLS